MGKNMARETHYKKLPLTLEQALSGKSIKIRLSGGATVKLNLKKGLHDGQLLRLKDIRGGRPRGGQGRELILQVSLLDHPFYRIEGLDVIAELPVSPAEAHSGCVRTFAGPDGKPLRLQIPPRVSEGQRLSIKQGGLKKEDQRGNLDFIIHIDENMALMEYMAVAPGRNQASLMN